MSSSPFTRCPNGPLDGLAHEFDVFDVPSSFSDREPVQRYMYCRRCGEVRALVLPPEEPTADQRLVRVPDLGDVELRAGAAPNTTPRED